MQGIIRKSVQHKDYGPVCDKTHAKDTMKRKTQGIIRKSVQHTDNAALRGKTQAKGTMQSNKTQV